MFFRVSPARNLSFATPRRERESPYGDIRILFEGDAVQVRHQSMSSPNNCFELDGEEYWGMDAILVRGGNGQWKLKSGSLGQRRWRTPHVQPQGEQRRAMLTTLGAMIDALVAEEPQLLPYASAAEKHKLADRRWGRATDLEHAMTSLTQERKTLEAEQKSHGAADASAEQITFVAPDSQVTWTVEATAPDEITFKSHHFVCGRTEYLEARLTFRVYDSRGEWLLNTTHLRRYGKLRKENFQSVDQAFAGVMKAWVNEHAHQFDDGRAAARVARLASIAALMTEHTKDLERLRAEASAPIVISRDEIGAMLRFGAAATREAALAYLAEGIEVDADGQPVADVAPPPADAASVLAAAAGPTAPPLVLESEDDAIARRAAERLARRGRTTGARAGRSR